MPRCNAQVFDKVTLHGNFSDPQEMLKDLATQLTVEAWDYDIIGTTDRLSY